MDEYTKYQTEALHRGEPQIKPDSIFNWMIKLRESGLLKTIPPKQAKVLWLLICYRGVNGWCWPSHKRLAVESGTSINTVKRAIRIGKACFGIRVKKGGGRKPNPGKENYRTNSYYFPLNEEISIWQPTRKKRKKADLKR